MVGLALTGLREFLGLSDGDWGRLLRGAGLSPKDLEGADALVPIERGFKVFSDAAMMSGRPALGVEYARAVQIGGTGPLGFALVSAHTVREGLQMLARFLPIVASVRMLRYEEDDEGGAIVWRYPVDATVDTQQFATWGAALVVDRLAVGLGADWRPLAVEIEGAAPEASAGILARLGPGTKFGCAQFRFVVEKRHLDCEMPQANETLHKLMTRLAEIENRSRGVASSVFEEEVRAQLSHLIRNGQTRIEDLAHEMGISLGQLRAMLREHDLDFSYLLNDVRRVTALSYLRETGLSITEITFALGYADCSVFTRACHKWFGRSPRAVRNMTG